MEKLDRISSLIMESIQNKTKTVIQICSELGIPASTTYRKLKKLEELKIVKKYYVIGIKRRRIAKYKLDAEANTN